jgi:pteridine reductase
MKSELSNTNAERVALITGSAARIGASIAKHLHQLGFNISLHYNHSEIAAQALADELNKLRANSALCLKADLRDISAIQELVNNTVHHWGKLDVLINNASSFYPTPLSEITKEQWDDLAGTNAVASAFLCKACFSALQLTKGCIINISDIAASTGRMDFLFYSMAKAALNNLTRSLARELAPDIRVNAIAPGAILPPNFSTSDTINNASEIDPLSISCLNYPGKAEDIAYAAEFLINNTYTSGQILNVDGGRRLKF